MDSNKKRKSSLKESSPIKKKKDNYDCSFQDKWLTDYSWLIKVNQTVGKCSLCSSSFTIRHDGVNAIEDHEKTLKHKAAVKSMKSNQVLTTFLTKKGTTEELNVTIIELAQVFHGVSHHHSYLSMDCGMKINSKLYSHSNLGKKVHCGKTKAVALVENVLAPKSIEMVLAEMNAGKESAVNFSIATDASNKGNVKLFPVVVRYFDINVGIKDRIIEFYEDSFETAEAIATRLSTLKNCGLKLEDVSSFSADNAPVNFGKNNSVFKKLTDLNTNIIKSNCNCHVIHNAARNACKSLSYDVENFILKVYADFANSTRNVRKLKECFEYLEMEYNNVLRHVVTRWLSLFHALERLLECWPAVKLYFIEQGEDETNKVVWSFVCDQEDELQDDLSSTLSLPECYLYFIHHFMFIMTQSILVLEKKSVTSCEVHDIMVSLKEKLECRHRDKFFGSKVASALKNLGPEKMVKFEKEALQVYAKAIAYLEKCYDFEKSPFQYFSIINFKKEPSYNDFIDSAKILGLHIDEDALYDEIQLLSKIVSAIKDLDEPTDKKWVKVFASGDKIFTELPKLVGKILSIPVSNAPVERIFSIMFNVWTDNRNKLNLSVVKSELFVKLNYDLTCDQFIDFLKKPEQISLLKKALSNEKYS